MKHLTTVTRYEPYKNTVILHLEDGKKATLSFRSADYEAIPIPGRELYSPTPLTWDVAPWWLRELLEGLTDADLSHEWKTDLLNQVITTQAPDSYLFLGYHGTAMTPKSPLDQWEVIDMSASEHSPIEARHDALDHWEAYLFDAHTNPVYEVTLERDRLPNVSKHFVVIGDYYEETLGELVANWLIEHGICAEEHVLNNAMEHPLQKA